MRESFAYSTITAEDLVQVLMTLTIEMMAQAFPDSATQADAALEQLANKLLDTSHDLPKDNRTGQLLKSLAFHLMGTEPGA
jgi:hypothetical protein